MSDHREKAVSLLVQGQRGCDHDENNVMGTLCPECAADALLAVLEDQEVKIQRRVAAALRERDGHIATLEAERDALDAELGAERQKVAALTTRMSKYLAQEETMDLHAACLPFRPFPKIPRLSRECVITEKLDGTNASVWISADGLVQAACKTRFITPQADNHGFAAWVHDNADRLRAVLGTGAHFGEWWGAGINRGYGLPKGDKRFSLFNQKKWGRTDVSPCLVVPVIVSGIFTTQLVELAIGDLRLGGSLAVPGWMKPEGVVIYHTAGHLLFKKTLEHDEEPKSK